MVEPISPSDVKKFIPDFIIETVNKLIVEKWDGDKAIILQDDIMDIVSSNDTDIDKPSRREVFDKGWLDFEPLYRKKVGMLNMTNLDIMDFIKHVLFLKRNSIL